MDSEYSVVDYEEKSPIKGLSQASVDKPGEGQELSHPVDPYISQPTWIYLQYLIPLLLASIFPLAFATFVSINGPTIAPSTLASYALHYPQVMGQVVTIFSTFLTGMTRLGLSGAAALWARKSLLRPQRIYELEMFFSLKNISVIWDWKHRKRTMFLSWFMVAVCGLLTSGFFALFNPIQMDVVLQRPSLQEYDISKHLEGSNGSAIELPSVLGSASGSDFYDETVKKSDIPSFLRSMARQYLASKDNSTKYHISSLTTLFSELNYTSFVGSTAGVFVNQTAFHNDSDHSSAVGSRYTLDLQGAWLDVSCQRDLSTSLNLTAIGQQATTWTQGCSGQDQVPIQSKNISHEFFRVFAWYLPCGDSKSKMHFISNEGSYTLEEYSTGPASTASSSKMPRQVPVRESNQIVYVSSVNVTREDVWVGMSCTIAPRVGNVHTVFDVDLQAFKPQRNNITTTTDSSAQASLLNKGIKNVEQHFYSLNVINYLEEAVERRKVALTNLEPGLMELILSSLFEFEVSVFKYKDLEFVESGLLSRDVKVVLAQRTIGWEMKRTNWLGLVPVMAISLTAFTMIILTAMADGQLTVFDPMNPVSLLAATSAGKIVLPNQELQETIGDPLDENALTTKIFYGEKDETWGLWSPGGDAKGGA